MKRSWVGVGVLAVALTGGLSTLGCGGAAPSVQVSSAGKGVKVGKEAPPPGAKKIGEVESVHGGGCGSLGMTGDRDSAVALLRNEAAKVGASYVRITSEKKPEEKGSCPDQRWILRGVAYQ